MGGKNNAKRDLEKLDFTRMGRGINVYNPSPDQIVGLLQMATEEIEGLANKTRVLEVYQHNPETIFVLQRSTAIDNSKNAIGFLAQLPLNRKGHQALFSGELNTANPDLKYICKQHEIPSAIYSWCIFVSRKTAGGISLVFERFSSPKNINAPLYCRASNENARQFFKSIGFQHEASYLGVTSSELMEYKRGEIDNNVKFDAPRYDSFNKPAKRKKDNLGISVVHDISQLMQITAIRASTFMAEQGCSFEEEFDGNDFSCTHLLGHVGESPSGCLRIRFFSSFAKIERLAVVKQARHTRLSSELIEAAIEFCRKKGYRNIYGQSDEKVVSLWKKHGFHPRTTKSTFSFSGLNLVEGDLELNLANDTINLSTDPMVLNRPEGQWHRTGILERKIQ